ncbi:hypothetical protein GCM10020256_13390 [Streptomyces thermocoprophilus]
MRAMNRPMPMVMPCLSASGIAFMIISRRPVTTSSMMTAPYITHMPIACGQVISGATCEERTPETERPAARARGTLPTKPISSVVRAAANAVAVISAFWPSVSPAASLPDRISGLSSRMYAIAMKVVMPPRTSRATVDCRWDMWKYRSSQDRPAGTRVPWPASSATVSGSSDCWVMWAYSQGS